MVHNTQGYATLILETGVDLAAVNAENLQIKYESPSGTRGYWAAEIYETTKLIKNFENTDLQEFGLWKVQAYFTVSGKNAFGARTTFEVQRKVA
jgi:hypothetical protein